MGHIIRAALGSGPLRLGFAPFPFYKVLLGSGPLQALRNSPAAFQIQDKHVFEKKEKKR